ncbi:hypothetical protein QQ045_025552 [Rhodiola kirilowii]
MVSKTIKRKWTKRYKHPRLLQEIQATAPLQIHLEVDTHIASPPTRNRRKDFLRKSVNMTIQDSPRLLPPQDIPERPTLVLDLDHTLICTTHYQPPARYDFVINYETDGYLNTSYVLKRPGLDEFLLRAADMYEVVIFTAGIREYASVVVDEIDPKGLISHRLYRDSCKVLDGKFVKDLDAIGRELKTVILVEDNRDACILNLENTVLLPPFSDDLEDVELDMVGYFLEVVLILFDDLRDGVNQYNNAGLGDDVLRFFP